jgi:hypothetical protein
MLHWLAALKYRTPLLFFFSKAKAFWKNAPKAPLPHVRSTSVWKQHRLAMILFECQKNGKEQ